MKHPPEQTVSQWARLLSLLVWPTVLAGLVLLVALPLAHSADSPRFQINEATTRLVDEVYLLNARLELQLSDEVIEALDSGVPITIEMQIEIRQPRNLLWDVIVAELSQRYALEHLALSGQYLVTSLNTGQRRSYQSRRAALLQLGRLHDFPMLDRRVLGVGERYTARLRARLDVEALPLPLRPVAYLTEAWNLTSDWHEWLLNP